MKTKHKKRCTWADIEKWYKISKSHWKLGKTRLEKYIYFDFVIWGQKRLKSFITGVIS